MHITQFEGCKTVTVQMDLPQHRHILLFVVFNGETALWRAFTTRGEFLSEVTLHSGSLSDRAIHAEVLHLQNAVEDNLLNDFPPFAYFS